MLAPLYSINSSPATITVVSPGAAQNATSVPVVALTVSLAAGRLLDFGGAKFARLTAAASIGDTALSVSAIPTALVNGDTAEIPSSPLLFDGWSKLSGDEQTAEQIRAEQLLGLSSPAYTGDDADRLALAIVLQINFQHARGLTDVDFLRQQANAKIGNTTTYRDRWVHPEAALIVARVTGVRQVRFTPPMLVGA